jgi:ElaB/YqjD/DUF883 family membrane-anchored ribosome-binding protein
MMPPLTQNRANSIHGNQESSFFGTGVSEVTDEAQARLKDAGDMLITVITNRPALALGTALAAGVFLGWLIKRR